MSELQVVWVYTYGKQCVVCVLGSLVGTPSGGAAACAVLSYRRVYVSHFVHCTAWVTLWLNATAVREQMGACLWRMRICVHEHAAQRAMVQIFCAVGSASFSLVSAGNAGSAKAGLTGCAVAR